MLCFGCKFGKFEVFDLVITWFPSFPFYAPAKRSNLGAAYSMSTACSVSDQLRCNEALLLQGFDTKFKKEREREVWQDKLQTVANLARSPKITALMQQGGGLAALGDLIRSCEHSAVGNSDRSTMRCQCCRPVWKLTTLLRLQGSQLWALYGSVL